MRARAVLGQYHFKTEQGIENFTDADAKAMTAEDPDYHRRDLRESIAKQDHPSGGWRCKSCRSRTR
jgi:catalase